MLIPLNSASANKSSYPITMNFNLTYSNATLPSTPWNTLVPIEFNFDIAPAPIPLTITTSTGLLANAFIG